MTSEQEIIARLDLLNEKLREANTNLRHIITLLEENIDVNQNLAKENDLASSLRQEAHQYRYIEVDLPGANLSELGLDSRIRRLLWLKKVYTIDQLVSYTAQQLQAIRGLGELSLQNIRARLSEKGLYLRGDEPNSSQE